MGCSRRGGGGIIGFKYTHIICIGILYSLQRDRRVNDSTNDRRQTHDIDFDIFRYKVPIKNCTPILYT